MNILDTTERLVIIGRTGGGKTMSALWFLSLMPTDEMPWIILDWKRDPSIAEIPYLQDIGISSPPPQPGIYVVRPMSGDEERVNDFLHDIWLRGNTGLYVDEGLMLKGSKAFVDLQTQGRSKHVPIITLTQLPVNIPRAVFTEASYIQCFYVLDERYRKIISQFSTITSEDLDELPRYWSWYYDVVENKKQLLKPVPDKKVIMASFRDRLAALYEIPVEKPAGEMQFERRRM